MREIKGLKCYEVWKVGDRNQLSRKYKEGYTPSILDMRKTKDGNKLIKCINDKVSYYIEYKYISIEDVNSMFIELKKINLCGRYINTDEKSLVFIGTLDYISISEFRAEFSFWEGIFEIFNKHYINFPDINKDINFSYSTIYRSSLSFFNSDLHNCNLKFENANIMYSTISLSLIKFFNSSILFSGAKSNYVINLYDLTISNNSKLDFKELKRLVIQKCRITSIIEISGAPDDLNFYETVNQGCIMINWENNNVEYAIINAKRKKETEIEKYKLISDDFLLLKENYRKQGQYEWEDAAYRAYMEYYTKSLKRGPKKAFNKFFGFISGYGTEVTKIFATCLISLLAFPVFYTSAFLPNTNIPIDYFSLKTQLCSYFRSMYFSAITFLTIGYGKLNPIDLGFQWWQCALTAIEGFWGLLLMSLVTVTIVRKILR